MKDFLFSHGHENIDAVVSSSVDLEKQSASEEAIECVGEMKREGKVLLMCTRKEAIYDDEAF